MGTTRLRLSENVAIVEKLTLVCFPIHLRDFFSSSLCIVNDKLFVRDVQGLPSASIPVATSSSSYLPALFQDQQKMAQTFSIQAGMNAEWSQT